MSVENDNSPLYLETDADRLTGLLADDALSLDLVSAFAGDRPLGEAEKNFFDELKSKRGGSFFSDLLYTITHQYFPKGSSEEVWNQILRHKHEMSLALKRNVRITVASLDYLSNIVTQIESATVIGEAHIATIVRLSLRDALTGLFNHAYFYQKTDSELRNYNRYGTVFSVMMVDVDDFRAFNESRGHQEGDRILTLIGEAIEKATRNTDFCCRYGGDEFSVVLPSTGEQEAGLLANRLRTMVERGFPGDIKITISIGIASCRKNASSSQALVKRADTALYQAKANGKNQVAISA